MKRSAGSSGIVDIEEVDFLYDARSERERRWKRRRLAIENFRVKSGRDGDPKRKISKNNKVASANKEFVLVEEDYGMFLKNLEQIGQSNVDYDAGDLYGHLDYIDVNDDDNEHAAGGVLDPEYVMFFKNLKEDGESYLLEFVESDGMQVVVKYEEASRINLGRQKRESPKRTVGSDSKKENENCSSILRNTSKKGKIESKTTLKNMSKKQSMGNESKSRNSRARVKCRQKAKKNEVKAEENVIRRKRGRPRKTPHTEDTHLAKRKCDHPFRSESVDESYSVFLSCLKVEGVQIVYAPEGGKRVVFEKDEDTDSNSDVMILENDQDRTPIFVCIFMPASSCFRNFFDDDLYFYLVSIILILQSC